MSNRFQKEELQTVALYLPVSLIRALDKINERHGCGSRSEVARVLLAQDLEVQLAMDELKEETENDVLREKD